MDNKKLNSIGSILFVEDDQTVAKQFLVELDKRKINVFYTENLEDAINLAMSHDVDVIVSDGMFPSKKGEGPSKNFIPLVKEVRKNDQEAEIIAWSNSTHVHEFCRKEGLESYSKMLMTNETFKAKGREYIEVKVMGPGAMADLIEEKILKINKD